ncbi:MAG: hypothetical protein IPN13_18690 [Bacteroidetes bacterium]|nr:hypothetical protein [Bacteroidota bacterium]
MLKQNNPDKLRQYYIGVFKGLHSIGKTYFPEAKNPVDKADAVLNSGYWTVQTVVPSIATQLENLDCLNVGICPLCGASPIGTDEKWPYNWNYNNGPSLLLCKECYNDGLKSQSENIKNRKGCYIATVCYASDENTKEVQLFKQYRDEVLIKYYFGNLFVEFYYHISPYFARKLNSCPKINEFVKIQILNRIYTRLKSKLK